MDGETRSLLPSPEGSDFKSFIRSVVVSQPEGVHYSLRSDEPFVVDPADGPANATEAEQHERDGSRGECLSEGKGGLLARLAHRRLRASDGNARRLNARRYLAYRRCPALANRGGKPTGLWAESPPASAEVLANSFAEYLAYGPGGELLQAAHRPPPR